MLQGSYVINPRRAELALRKAVWRPLKTLKSRVLVPQVVGRRRGGTPPHHHDQTDAVAARGVAAGGPVGSGQLRPAGPGPPAPVPGGGLAHAPLPAGVVRLLLSGHRGIPGRHLQRLRRSSEGAAGADQGGEGGPEEERPEDVEPDGTAGGRTETAVLPVPDGGSWRPWRLFSHVIDSWCSYVVVFFLF